MSNRNKCCIEIQHLTNQKIFEHKVEPKQMLYWNRNNFFHILNPNQVEPKQMLYWNEGQLKLVVLFFLVEPKQMLYWNTSQKICNSFIFSRTETNVVLKSTR